jgi:hypothetical protein
MSTTTRPELSETNRWWISKHRYYELRHFCLQYPEWKQQTAEIDGLASRDMMRDHVNEGRVSDPTSVFAQARAFLNDRIELVEKAAYEACGHQFWHTILVAAVTEGASYDVLEARTGMMPVSRGEWYEMYRKFFWVLDKMRA